MGRRKVKKTVYFHGTTELGRVGNVLDVQIAASQAGRIETAAEYAASGGLCGPRTLAGQLPREPGKPVTWEHLKWLPVTRTVVVVADPNPHICDWRCMGGAPGGECYCECRGRNHGIRYVAKGQFAA